MKSGQQAARGTGESGNVLVPVLFLAIVMGGMAGAMYLRSFTASRATSRNNTETRLLLAAESGLNVNSARMATDPLYAVKDTARFTFDDTLRAYVGATESLAADADTRVSFSLRVQYLNGSTPVVFADRTKPTEDWTTVAISSRSEAAGLVREVTSRYRWEMGPDYSSTFISDSLSSGADIGGGKKQAQAGDVVFDDKGRPGQQYLFGGVRANGQAWIDGSTGLLAMTADNAASVFGAFKGGVSTLLGGTADQIPDFTAPDTPTQLFSFPRFEAVAAAGGGAVYNDIPSFLTAMKSANTAGKPLEGVIVLKIDSATTGSSPHIKASDLPGGIHVRGTLVFRFSAGTDPKYKVFIEVPMRINPADLSTWNPAVESTYTTGYPPVFADATKAPWKYDIAPTHENFSQNGDLPALIFENGVVDIHHEANICGVVYGPSFIEIENKNGQTQYFNGAVIGGAGIYLEGHSSAGRQGFRFARDTLDQLETFNNRGKALVRSGFSIVR